MTSSTSHSDAGEAFPRALALSLAVMLGAWSIGAIYSMLGNPEVRLLKHGTLVKQAWSRKLDATHPAKVVVCGGSSSSFSINGSRGLGQWGLPVSNMALHAGLGPKVLTRLALAETRAGDTLLVTMEPDLFSGDLEPTNTGIQFGIALGRPALAGFGDGLPEIHAAGWRAYFTALRPGGYHFFTLLGKILRGAPLYRYQAGDFDESGHQQTLVRVPVHRSMDRYQLSQPAKHWLAALRDWAAANRINLLYDLPWAYCPESDLPEQRRLNAAFLLEVSEFLPVLADSRVGAYPSIESYADTALHMTAEGAALRTDQLVENLRAKRTWTKEELSAMAGANPAR